MIKEEENDKGDTGDLWWLFIRLIQTIWDKDKTPQQML